MTVLNHPGHLHDEYFSGLSGIDKNLIARAKQASRNFYNIEKQIVSLVNPVVAATTAEIDNGTAKINVGKVSDEVVQGLPLQIIRVADTQDITVIRELFRQVAQCIRKENISDDLNRDLKLIDDQIDLHIQMAAQQPVPERSGAPKLTLVKR